MLAKFEERENGQAEYLRIKLFYVCHICIEFQVKQLTNNVNFCCSQMDFINVTTEYCLDVTSSCGGLAVFFIIFFFF